MRWAALVLPVLLGCGYHFTGGAPPLPEGLRSVRVPVFANRTPEISAEVTFTQAMRAQLERAQVLGGEASDAVLEGTLIRFGTSPIDDRGTLVSYRLTGVLQLRLLSQGRVVSAATVSGTENYLTGASDDVLLSEANRQEALHRLATELAEEGYQRIASGE